MAIEVLLRFLNPDSTEDINKRLAQLARGIGARDAVNANAADTPVIALGDLAPGNHPVQIGQPTYIRGGVFFGGMLTTLNGGPDNQIKIQPFAAIGFDGLEARDTEANVIDLPQSHPTLDTDFYVVLHLEYVPQGTPFAELLVMRVSDWTGSSNPSRYVRLGGFTLPAGANTIEPSDFVYGDRDVIDPLHRFQRRPAVQEVADLPTADQGTQDWDIRTVVEFKRDYIYDPNLVAWTPLGATEDLENVGARNNELFAQWLRANEGSGLVGGELHSTASPYGIGRLPVLNYGPDNIIEAPIEGDPNFENRVNVGNLQLLVNGHFVQTHYRQLTLPAAPTAPAPDRYDLIYIEVWREELTVNPDLFQHDAWDPGTPIDWLDIQQAIETMQQVEGASLDLSNADLNSIVFTADHKMVVTKWQVHVLEDVGPTPLNNAWDIPSFLNTPTSALGNPFQATTLAEGDIRLWYATNPDAYDESPGTGKISWGMPLAVVRRTSDEIPFGGANGIANLRPNGRRYVSTVCPFVNTSFYSQLRGLIGAAEFTANHSTTSYPIPSGCLDNIKNPLVLNDGGPGRLGIQTGRFHMDGVRFTHSAETIMPDAPVVGLNALRRDMVIMTLRYVLYPDSTSETIREYEPFASNGQDDGRTTRMATPVVRFEVFEAASTGTMHDAMTLAGYIHSSTDPGLWYRDTTIAAPVTHYYTISGTRFEVSDIDDGRVNVLGRSFAIPIALIHRRNTQPWLEDTNQNGGTGRPDGLDAVSVDAADILDCRHLVSEYLDTKQIVEATINALADGSLRQRMATNSFGSGGVQLDKTDFLYSPVGPVPPGGNEMLPDPDDHRSIWSEAVEKMPITLRTSVTATFSTGVITWTYVGAAPHNGILEIDVTSNMPGTYILTEGVNGTPSYGPVTVHGELARDTATRAFELLTRTGNWTVNATDAHGRPLRMEAPFEVATLPGTPDALFSYMVVSDHITDPFVDDVRYSNNRGLAEIPDYVYDAAYGDPPTNPLGVRRLSTRMNIPSDGGGLIMVSTAAVEAHLGLAPGTLGVYYAHVLSVEGTDGVSTPVAGVQLVNPMGFPHIEIQLVGPGGVNKNCEVEVSYITTTIESWINVLPGSRGVQALLSYDTRAGAVASANEAHPISGTRSLHYATDLGSPLTPDVVALWQRPAGSLPNDSYNLRRPSIASEYYESNYGAVNDQISGFYTNTLLVQWDEATLPIVGDDFVILSILCVPPYSGGVHDIKIRYKYTPYQGMSEHLRGIPADQIAALRNMSHGWVQATSDLHITTNGTGVPLLTKLPGPPHGGSSTPVIREFSWPTGRDELGRFILNPDSVALASDPSEDGHYGRTGIIKRPWRGVNHRLPWYTDFGSAWNIQPGRVYPHEIANKPIGIAALDLLSAMNTYPNGADLSLLTPVSIVEGGARNHIVLPVGNGQQHYGPNQLGLNPFDCNRLIGYTPDQRAEVTLTETLELKHFHQGIRGLWSGRELHLRAVLGGTMAFLANLNSTFFETWPGEPSYSASPTTPIDLPEYMAVTGNRKHVTSVHQEPTGYVSFAGVMVQALRDATLGLGTNPMAGLSFVKVGASMNRTWPLEATEISIGWCHDVVWPLYRPLVLPRENS